MSDPLFALDGDAFVPSGLARGPWSADALHGGPVAALLAGLAERLQPEPLQPVRLTLELLRPVPLAPLAGRARVLRPGRKVQLAESSLWRGDQELARATLLSIRRAPLPLPESHGGSRAVAPPGPDTVEASAPPRWSEPSAAYHSHAVEHRIVRGSWGELGPCTDWIRLRVPVLAGEAPSPLQRVAAAADFGNGISAALPFGVWRFINPDLTVHLERLPQGAWVCLDAETWLGEGGVGLAESALYDERGRLGRSLQSLLLERA
jgi:hypothetical protein